MSTPSTPPADPSHPPAEEPKKKGKKGEGEKPEGEKDHKTAEKKESWYDRAPQKVAQGSWKVIKGISKYVWQGVRGALRGTWNMTAGTAVIAPVASFGRHLSEKFHTVEELGRQMVKEAGERHHFGKLGPVIKGIMQSTLLAAGLVFTTPAAMAGGSAMKFTEGMQNVGDAIIMKYDKRKSNGSAAKKETHAEEKNDDTGEKPH